MLIRSCNISFNLLAQINGYGEKVKCDGKEKRLSGSYNTEEKEGGKNDRMKEKE